MGTIYAADFFSGAGGLSLGFEAASTNLRMALASDFDAGAAATYQHNSPQTVFVHSDVRTLDQVTLERALQQNLHGPRLNQIELVIGGPPCQGYSMANRHSWNADNDKNWLFEHYAQLITNVIKPEMFVLENVPGLLRLEEGVFLDFLLTDAFPGYHVHYALLNAVDFGVPQVRERIFVVGVRKRSDAEILSLSSLFPTGNRAKPVTVRDALLGDLPEESNASYTRYMFKEDGVVGFHPQPYAGAASNPYQSIMRTGATELLHNHYTSSQTQQSINIFKALGQGKSAKHLRREEPERFRELFAHYTNPNNIHSNVYHRLHPDTPSRTIMHFRKNMTVHPCQDRGLTVREAARLQSFPDRFVFKGSLGQQQQQVGNAVPPLLARALAEQLIPFLQRRLAERGSKK